LVLLIIVACFVSRQASFLTFALAYIVAPLGAAAAGLWALRKLIFPVSSLDHTLLPRMLKFSLPILPASFVGYMATNYLDAFFITHYLSGAALGVYAVAYLISGTTLQLPLLVGTVLMPLFITLQIDGTDDRARRFMLNVLPLLTLLWGAVCAFVAAFGGFLIPQMFGEQFRGVGELLWPLMTAAAFAGPVLMGYAPFSNSKSLTYIAMIGAIASALTNVLLNFLLIPSFGLVGCAWATTAAFAVNFVVVIALVHWRLLPSPTWTLQALLPIVVGAICAAMYAISFKALAITLLLSVLLALLYRKSVIVGFRMLNNFQRSSSVLAGQA
jgi:O-antigen/teichoic acid export membrane protein